MASGVVVVVCLAVAVLALVAAALCGLTLWRQATALGRQVQAAAAALADATARFGELPARDAQQAPTGLPGSGQDLPVRSTSPS